MVASTHVLTTITTVASLGTLIEFYDLFIGGLAASMAWPALFFPNFQPSLAIAAGLGSYAAAQITRPVGALAFGHLGDRVGRKTSLIWTLIFTGGGVLGTALVPPYVSIGLLAPTLLILFRLITGLGLGGEWGGAASIVAEFAAKSKRRAFWTSWIQNMSITGSTLSAVAYTIARANLSGADFVAFGWRYIFLVGAAAIAVAGALRYKISESPIFQEAARKRELTRVPAGNLLKERWRTLVVLLLAVVPPIQFTSFILAPYTVGYLTALKMSDFTISSFIALSGLVGLAVGVATGVIAGYIGRKRLILVVTSFLQLIFIYPFFILLRTGAIAGNFALVFWMITLMQAIRSSGQAVVPAVLTEQFGAKYRVTGSGLAYQLSTFLAGGVLLSFLISPLEKAYGEIGVMPYVAVTWIILCTLGVILPGLFTRDQAQLPA